MKHFGSLQVFPPPLVIGWIIQPGESQTSPIQIIIGPSVVKCGIYIWVQLDDRVEM